MDGQPESVDPNSIPVSDWHNNPGNLRYSGIDYEGSMGVDPKTNFVIFDTPEHGRRALVGDVGAKQRRGLDTPHKLIDAYLGKDTPENVNSPETKANYKQHIVDSLGMKDVHETFPELSSIPLADAVSSFESGRWKKPQEEDSKSGKGFDGRPLTSSEDEELHPGESIRGGDPKRDSRVEDAQSNALKVMGGIGGAGVATSGELAKRILPLVPNAWNHVFGSENPNRPSTRSALQRWLNGQTSLHINLSDLEKEYNKFLQEKNPGAEPVKLRMSSEVSQALEAMQPVPGERVKTTHARGSTYKTTPGQPGWDTTKYESNPKTPIRNIYNRGVTSTKNFVSGAIPTVRKIGLGALGGAQALSGGYDTWNHAVDKAHGWMDPRTITKGAATLGGLGLMIPWKPAQIAGALAMAPEAYISGKDIPKEDYRDRLNLGLPRSRSYQELRDNKPIPERTNSVSGTIKNN